MTAKNDITGDKIQTKSPSAAFDEGFERIFGKPTKAIKLTEESLKNMLLDASVPKPPPGYTEEELERDNPHNQWMYEDKQP